jgi:hypothetical protein
MLPLMPFQVNHGTRLLSVTMTKGHCDTRNWHRRFQEIENRYRLLHDEFSSVNKNDHHFHLACRQLDAKNDLVCATKTFARIGEVSLSTCSS